jgi:hypothetical protein
MANPLVRSAAINFPFGPSGGSGDNITSLANNTVRGLGSISPVAGATSPASDWVVGDIKITTGTSPTSGGTIEMHIVVSTDGTIFTGGVNPATGSDQATAWNAAVAADPTLATPTQVITVTGTSNVAYFFRGFSLVGVLGYVPDFWSLLIFNKTGAALNATAGNHNTSYRAETYA